VIFHINFRISLPESMKQPTEVLIGLVFNL
jgi:hypothetical protein